MHLSFFLKFCWCSLRLHQLCVARAILIFLLHLLLHCVYLLLLATFLLQSLSSCDGRSSRSPTTLRNLGGSFVAITCSLDVAGRRAIYFPYEIWLFLNMLHRYCNFLSFSHLFPRFIILFIISSSVLEQAGFSEIEGVISSNPTWQCLHFVFFCIHLNSRACSK